MCQTTIPTLSLTPHTYLHFPRSRFHKFFFFYSASSKQYSSSPRTLGHAVNVFRSWLTGTGVKNRQCKTARHDLFPRQSVLKRSFSASTIFSKAEPSHTRTWVSPLVLAQLSFCCPKLSAAAKWTGDCPESFTLHTPHSTPPTSHFPLHNPHSTLHTARSPLHTPHFTLHTSHSPLSALRSTLHTPHSYFTLHTLHSRHSPLSTLRSSLHTSHSPLHTPQFALSTSLWPLHSQHFTLHTSHSPRHTSVSTLHTPHFKLHAPFEGHEVPRLPQWWPGVLLERCATLHAWSLTLATRNETSHLLKHHIL